MLRLLFDPFGLLASLLAALRGRRASAPGHEDRATPQAEVLPFEHHAARRRTRVQRRRARGRGAAPRVPRAPV